MSIVRTDRCYRLPALGERVLDEITAGKRRNNAISADDGRKSIGIYGEDA